MGLTLITAPMQSAVALDAVKAHCSVFHDDDDKLFNSLIDAATIQAQEYTQRQFISATYALSLNFFEEILELPKAPLISVDKIEYIAKNESSYTLLDTDIYMVDTTSLCGLIARRIGKFFPETEPCFNAVVITFSCGYGEDESFVPAPLKHWIMMRVATMYENREEVVNGIVSNEVNTPFNGMLLKQYRVHNV